MEDPILILNQYKRIEKLGGGSYGDVYLYEADNISYAVKRITMFNTISTMMEISMLNSLSHPYILKPFEVISLSKGIENIVLPLSSKSLYDVISSVLKMSQIILISHQILTALDYMHQNNVIHRDIKTDNIILIDTKAYIIDFGLSTYIFDNTCKNPNVYTYNYRAPEVFAQIPYDTKADIFAMGCTIYEMIYGKYMANITEKRGTKGYMQMLEAIQEAKIKISSDNSLQQDMKDLLLSMIDENPDNRLIAKELLHMPIFSKYTYSTPDIIKWKVVSNPESSKQIFESKTLSTGAAEYAMRLSSLLDLDSLIDTSDPSQIENVRQIIVRLAYCVYEDKVSKVMYQLMENKEQVPNYQMVELAQKIFKQLGSNCIVL